MFLSQAPLPRTMYGSTKPTTNLHVCWSTKTLVHFKLRKASVLLLVLCVSHHYTWSSLGQKVVCVKVSLFPWPTYNVSHLPFSYSPSLLTEETAFIWADLSLDIFIRICTKLQKSCRVCNHTHSPVATRLMTINTAWFAHFVYVWIKTSKVLSKHCSLMHNETTDV